jgi:hypothetical protein
LPWRGFSYLHVWTTEWKQVKKKWKAQYPGDVFSESWLSQNISCGSQNLMLRHRLCNLICNKLYMSPTLCFSKIISALEFPSKSNLNFLSILLVAWATKYAVKNQNGECLSLWAVLSSFVFIIASFYDYWCPLALQL